MITLKIIQLKKKFGHKTIFSDVSFTHRKGVLGITGSNGSGKSTLLKCLGHILRPTRGEMIWKNNKKELKEEIFKKKLGYAAPYINLYEGFSCIENLEFLAKVRHQTFYKDQIQHWIQKAGLEPVANQTFGRLSSGQQQRLKLASALFHQPDILLLDEPGTNLDEKGNIIIKELISEYRQTQKIVLLASNNTAELDLCDRLFSVENQAFTDEY